MNINDAFPGKYLKASDLQGKNVTVTIESVVLEQVGQKKETKMILRFAGKERGMVLNKTNASVLASTFGPETDHWAGKKAKIKSEMVPFQGNMLPGLRIYPDPDSVSMTPVLRGSPPPRAPLMAPPTADEPYDADEFEDAPPF